MTIEGSLKFVYWFAIRKLGVLVCHSKIVFSIRGILHSVESFSLSHTVLLYGCTWSVNLAGSNSVQIDLNIYRAAVPVIWLKSTPSKHPLSCTLEALGLPKRTQSWDCGQHTQNCLEDLGVPPEFPMVPIPSHPGSPASCRTTLPGQVQKPWLHL